MRQRVIMNWGISSFYGWGVYGLNLALQWVNDADLEPMCAIPIRPIELVLDPLQRLALEPFLALSGSLLTVLQPWSGSHYTVACPVVSFIDLKASDGDQRITGQPTIGTVFFETAHLAAEAVARAASLPLVVAGSDWNKRVLNEHGLNNVVTVVQGVDRTLFHPAPAGGWLGGRFCVFSGGKLEFRKAQDIVLAAFRVFATRHPEALLVTAWHSPWPQVARTLDQSLLAGPVPLTTNGIVDVCGWAISNDIDPDQVLDLGVIPNRQLPAVLREMDVAVFPNRCEGGTNLVAMECMACGVPVILSRNTGHLDLIAEDNCFVLERQTAMEGDRAGIGGVPGWGESSVDEVVEILERVFRDRLVARRRGERAAAMMTELTWARTADRLKRLLLERD